MKQLFHSLDGYEGFITNSVPRWLFIGSYASRSHAIIAIYHTVPGYEQIQVLNGQLITFLIIE